MSNAVDILAAGGICNAQLVAEIAETAGLELAAAAAMLEKESSGGRNVWGHDGVPTGNAYVKGSEVTRAAYMAYKQALETGPGRPPGRRAVPADLRPVPGPGRQHGRLLGALVQHARGLPGAAGPDQ
jgi:hypothetical protein